MADSFGFDIVVGYNHGTVTGSGEYGEGDIVTLIATPDEHYKFVNWMLIRSQEEDIALEESRVMISDDFLKPYREDDAVVIGTNPIFIYNTSRGTMFEDGNSYLIFANIVPKDIYTITVSSAYGTPYISRTTVEEGESVTIRAREYPGVVFTHWSDGSVELERVFTPTSNLQLVAYYTIVDTTVSTYQYRAYVKDSRNMNGLPKAFLIATSFTLREDLMSTANSTINVMGVPTNINNGDVLVLYNPKGKVLYRGIITQIASNSIQCEQMQSFYKGTWLAENMPRTSLEDEVVQILTKYGNGFVGSSTYQDTLMYSKYHPIVPMAGSSTAGHLETFEAQETKDMTEFIYELFNKYGMILEFNVPYGSEDGSVKVFIPEYQPIKISDNVECVTSLSPVTEIEEANKLVIFSKNGVYRTTYYATTTSGIVEQPPTDVGRFNVVNTLIVFSDDPKETIVESNLPTEMFNHYLSFNLLLNNKIYDWYSWKLGMPLQVWNGSDYYSTIYTAYELTKEENANPVSVKVECGKVRLTLTKKLARIFNA